MKRKSNHLEEYVNNSKSQSIPGAADITREILSNEVIDFNHLVKLESFLRDNKDTDVQCKELDNSKFIVKLLVAYNATLSPKDLLINSILSTLEQNFKVNFSPISPLVWGAKSQDHYEQLATLGSTLHRIDPDAILDYFNPELVWKTVKFLSVPDREEIYDVRFVMQVMNSIVHPGSDISCRKIVECNLLSLLFACTSHHSKDVRSAAYYMLQKYLSLLNELKKEKDDFSEKPIFIYLIRLFKQSIEESGIRISHMITHFFARTCKLIFHPEDPVYTSVLSFLCLKPQIDLKLVPELYKLLFSTSVEKYKPEREWILSLISEALIDTMDYTVLQNRSVIKLLLCLFGSCIADQPARKLILQTLKAAVLIPSSAQDLFVRYNLHTWIASVIDLQHLTRWERNFLAQIFLILTENMRIACQKSESQCGKTEKIQINIAGKRICQVLEPLVEIDDVCRTRYDSVESAIHSKWKSKHRHSDVGETED